MHFTSPLHYAKGQAQPDNLILDGQYTGIFYDAMLMTLRLHPINTGVHLKKIVLFD